MSYSWVNQSSASYSWDDDTDLGYTDPWKQLNRASTFSPVEPASAETPAPVERGDRESRVGGGGLLTQAGGHVLGTAGGFADALSGGFQTTLSNIGLSLSTWVSDNEGALESAQEPLQKTKEQEAFASAIASQGEPDGLWDAITNVGSAAADRPLGALHETVAQLPNSAVAMAGMAAGGKAGAAVGALTGPAAPIAVPVLAFIGGLVGAGIATASIETGANTRIAAQDGELTDEELSTASRQGIVKGLTIGAVDRVTMGVGRFIQGAGGRSAQRAVTKVLRDNGVDLASDVAVRAALETPEIAARAVKAVEVAASSANSLAQRAGRTGANLALEVPSEGFGEYLGSRLAGQEVSMTDVALESMLSIPQSVAETAWARGTVDTSQADAITNQVENAIFSERAGGAESAIDAMNPLKTTFMQVDDAYLNAGGDELQRRLSAADLAVQSYPDAVARSRAQGAIAAERVNAETQALENEFKQSMVPLSEPAYTIEGEATGSPVSVWTGRRGDGYPSAEAAERGLEGRKKAEPGLDWKVEPMPNGRFAINGYDPSAGLDVDPSIPAREEAERTALQEMYLARDAVEQSLPPKVKANEPVSNRMELKQAIAAIGGINIDQARSEGIDVPSGNDKSNFGLGRKRIFTKNGKTMDEAAELLAELGFFEGEEAGGNALLAKLSDSWGGVDVYSPTSPDAAARVSAALMMDDIDQAIDAFERESLDDEFDPPPEFSERMEAPETKLNYAVLEADILNIPADRIDSLIDAAPTTEDAVNAVRREVSDYKARRKDEIADSSRGGEGDSGASPQADGAQTTERPTLDLASETEAERQSREQAETVALQAQERERTEAEQRAQADAEVGQFTLTGSDRTADVMAAGGQGDLLGAAPTTASNNEAPPDSNQGQLPATEAEAAQDRPAQDSARVSGKQIVASLEVGKPVGDIPLPTKHPLPSAISRDTFTQTTDKFYGISQAIDEAQTTSRAYDMAISSGEGQKHIRPEHLMRRRQGLLEELRKHNSKLARNGSSSHKQVIAAWKDLNQTENDIAASRDLLPEQWAQFDANQSALDSLKAGDEVDLELHGGLGETVTGVVVRKNKNNWRVKYPGSGISEGELLPRGMLRPAGAPPAWGVNQDAASSQNASFAEATAFGSRPVSEGEVAFITRHLDLPSIRNGDRTAILDRAKEAGLVNDDGTLAVKNLSADQRKTLRSAVRNLENEQAQYLADYADLLDDVSDAPEKPMLRLVVDNTSSASQETDQSSEVTSTEPNLDAARAIMIEQRGLNPMDKKAAANMKRKIRALAKKTPATDEKTVLALDIAATRLDMQNLEFAPADAAPTTQPAPDTPAKTVASTERSVPQDGGTGVNNLDSRPISYAEFSQQYREAFENANKYTPDQVGSRTFTDKMAMLADQYPEYMDKFDRELEASTGQVPQATIESFTDKSIIVRGVSKAEGESLFDGMTGKPMWNDKQGAWVFSKKREAEVRKVLGSRLDSAESRDIAAGRLPVEDARQTERERKIREAGPDDAKESSDLTSQLTALSDSELDALVDEVADEKRAAETDKPARQRKTRTKSGQPRKRKAPVDKVSDTEAVQREAGEIAKSLGVNLSSAGKNALEGLTELFGGKNTLRSGLSFDDDTYAKAKPHFEAMLKDFSEAGKDVRELIGALVDAFGTGVKPYLKRFVEDIRAEQAAARENVSSIELAQKFSNAFSAGQSFRSITEARKYASDVLGRDVKSGTADAKMVDEAIELGAVMRARAIVAEGAEQGETYRRLVDLYAQMPKLSTRTSTSVAQQAYSTPVPLAYLAAEIAGINADSVVLESSAGNGAMTITASPENVIANELNPDRAANLRATLPGAVITEKDASAWAPDTEVDVVAINPPFGVVKDADGTNRRFDVNDQYSTGEIDHAIALKSLSAMKDDGSAVLIVGSVAKTATTEDARSDAYNAKAKREFYLTLYRDYNVVDHFTVAGELYEKQGAGWPVDVILIRGRGKSSKPVPAAEPPRIYRSWDALSEVLNAKYQDTTGVSGQTDDRTAGGKQQADAGNERTGLDGRAASDRGESQSTENNQSAGVRDGLVAGQPGGARPDRSEPGQDARPAPSARSDAGTRRAALEKSDGENARQVTYQPVSGAASMGTLVPVNMQTSTQSALDNLRARVGDIDGYVAERLGYGDDLGAYFGAEQIDAIALALDNMERGAGFIIGDQTGIGKGRVVAAIIRYAMRSGRTPIFVTEKPNLYGDMYRDLNDIGVAEMLGRAPKILMTNAATTVPLDDDGAVLKSGSAASHNKQLLSHAAQHSIGDNDVVFTTYSQMQTLKGDITARMRFLESIAPGSIVVFDESHNAGGSTQQQQRGKKDDKPEMNRAVFARQLARTAHGVLYSSATYAKRPDVMDLYATTDMRLAVADISNLAEAIQKGGVPMQQAVASMLSEAGQYIRRERSFDGVTYNSPTVATDRAMYSGYSSALNVIQQFSERYIQAALKNADRAIKAEGKAISGDGSVGGAGASSTNFTSVMHNLIDQMLLSIKADAAADRAIEAIKNGEKPVITVANTMGSFIKDFVDEVEASPGDRVAIDFNSMLEKYIERTRWITIKKPFAKKGEKGEKHYLTDEELGPAGVAAYENALNQIRALDLSGLPVSPIDHIRMRLKNAGYKVGEITGRTAMLDYRTDGAYYQTRSASEVSIAGRRRAISGFNGGDLDAMIINQAGSTGLSLHASATFKDQRKRRMIIAQAEKNIDTHMQMLGRVHRTGQVLTPEYDQLVADVPAEKRPAAVLAKKMASLNANTTASRGGALTAEDTPDFMNQYGDDVAARLMSDMPEIHGQLGKPLKESDTGLESEDAMRRVTGRIPLLSVDDQEIIYEMLESEYAALIEQKEAAGESVLEAKTLELDAEVKERRQVVAPQAGGSPFADGVYVETLNVKRLGKPHPSSKVLEMVADNIGSDVPESTSVGVSLKMLQKDARKPMEELWRSTMQQLQGYKVEALDSIEDEKVLKNARAKLDGQQDRLKSVLTLAHPGKTVRVLTDTGNLYGVVTKLARTGKAKNPVALGSWKITIALADASRQMTVPLSQVFTRQTEPSTMPSGTMLIEPAANIMDGLSIIEAFDTLQVESRENRTMITGNMLAGFDHVNGKGTIVNFTGNDGSVRQGILLPKNLNYDGMQADQPVEFREPAQVLSFIALGHTARSSDQAITLAEDGDNVRIKINSSKKHGGKYYLDRGVLDAVGADFIRAGNHMQTTIGNDQAPAVIEALRRVGAGFRATDNLPDARKVVSGDAKMSRGRASRNTHTTDSLRTAMDEAFPGVAGALERGGRLKVIGNADIPENLRALRSEAKNDLLALAAEAKDGVAENRTVEIGPVTEEQAAEVQAQIGLDASGFTHTADAYAVRHVLKEHGDQSSEQSRGQSAITERDIAALPDVLFEPDFTAYGEKNRRGQDIIMSAKKMEDGTVLVVQEVRTGRKRLALLSMRKVPAAKDALSVLRTSPLYARDDGGDALSIVEHSRTSTGEIQYSQNGSIQAYVKDGVVHMVADNIDQQASVKGLMLHEIGVHLTRLGKNDKEFQSILRQFDVMTRNSEKAKAALARVPDDTPESLRMEEAMGYYVEDNPNLSFSKKVVAWFKSKLKSWLGDVKGMDRSRLMRWANTLTESDIIYMAQSATRKVGEGRTANADGLQSRKSGGASTDTSAVLFSRRAPRQADIIMAEKLGMREKAGAITRIREAAATASLRNMLQRVEEGLFDGLIGMKRAENRAGTGIGAGDYAGSGYVGARLSTGVADVMTAILDHGAPEWSGGVIVAKNDSRGLLDTFGDLGEDLNDWLGWMAGNRAQELLSQGREKNLSEDDIQELLSLDDGKEAKFRKAKREYNRMNSALLDLAEQAGLIDPKGRSQWESEWYVPFYREAGNDMIAPRTKRGLSHQSSGIRRLKGSDEATGDLLENILSNNLKLVDASMKNMALLKSIDNLADTDDVKKVGLAMASAIVPRKQLYDILDRDARSAPLLAALRRNSGDYESAILELQEEGRDATAEELLSDAVSTFIDEQDTGGVEKLWAVVAPTDPDIVRVKRDGKSEFYRVNDPALLRAYTHLNGRGLDGFVWRSSRFMKRLLTTGVTTSPPFMMRNFIRDAAHAWAINPDNFRFGIDSMRGVVSSFREDSAYRDLMFAGSSFQGGFIHGNDPEAGAQLIRRGLRRKGVKGDQANEYLKSLLNTPEKMFDALQKGWQIYREAGDKIENASRVATYRAALDAGKTKAQALLEAKDLMDYSMHGNFVALQVFTDTVPFLNARLQGLYKLGRAGATNPKQVSVSLAKIAAISVLIAAMNDDDERYKKLKDWDKYANWHFFIGDQHLRIPKPFEIGLIAGTLPEQLLYTITGSQHGSKLGKALKHMIVSTLEINPIPQIFRPAIEAGFNYDVFRQRGIDSMGDLRELPEDRANAYTSEAMKALGKQFGVSPKRLEHLWRGYLGTMGGYILETTDMVLRGLDSNAPPRPAWRVTDSSLVNWFWAGDVNERSAQSVDDFYELMQEISQTYTSWRNKYPYEAEEGNAMAEANAEMLSLYKPMNRVNRSLSELRKERRAVMQDPDMSPEDKRAALKAVTTAMNALTRDAVDGALEAL